jgi:hypothetical protein
MPPPPPPTFNFTLDYFVKQTFEMLIPPDATLCCDLGRIFPGNRSITRWYESKTSSFFSENVTAIRAKFTQIIHASSAVMMLSFREVSVIFNTPLPNLNKTLYNDVVKLTASNSEHISKTFSTRFHPQKGVPVVPSLRAKQVVAGRC